MTGALVRYTPGSTPAIVTAHGLVLIGGEVSPILVSRLWDDVSAGRGLAAVLEALTGAFGTSLAAIPPFVVALAEGAAVRFAVRGPLSVSVTGSAGAEAISGTGVTTWTERVIADAAVVRIDVVHADVVAGGEEPSLPVGAGVVLVDAIEWRPSSDASAPAEQPAPAEVPAPAEPAAPAEVPAPAEPAAPIEVPAPAEPSAPVESPPPAPPTPPIMPVTPRLNPGSPQPVRGPLPDSGAGLIDSVPRVFTPADGDTLLPPESTLTELEADEVPWEATIARRPAAAGSDGADGDDSADAENSDQVVAGGDHDGQTISVAQARALRDSAYSDKADSTSASSDGADSGSAEPARADATISVPAFDSAPPPLAPPRPPAPGRILLSTGQMLVLDRTVIIGRRPRSTRVTGTDLPHLVAVDSPQQDISRSHVELRVEGDSIVATDLHTTNGTTLLRAGADPMRLHPGEPTVVVPGDLIDLGDDISAEILAIEETG